MRCYRCRKHGHEVTMNKRNGIARCPRCGKEVRYKTRSYHEPESPGCLTKITIPAFLLLLLFGIIVQHPWVLAVLILPLIWLVYKLMKMDD